MKSFSIRRINILTKKLLSELSLKHHGGTVCIFVDENKHVVDEVSNLRNSKIIADFSCVNPVMQNKHSPSVVVLRDVAKDCKVSHNI